MPHRPELLLMTDITCKGEKAKTAQVTNTDASGMQELTKAKKKHSKDPWLL